MTVRVSDERSSRFYTENVQQNYCTYEKLKSLFLHTRHLLPAADCGKGKEGLTAKSNSVRQYYIMRSRNLSTSRPSGRFLLLSAEFLSHSAPVETLHDHPAASRYAGLARKTDDLTESKIPPEPLEQGGAGGIFCCYSAAIFGVRD